MTAFKLRFGYKFEAAHRLTHSCATRCTTPHGHTWRADVALQSKKADLDEADMVVEFGKVKRAWRQFIDETLDHSMMINVEDPLLQPIKENVEGARLLPFPCDPTTERLAQMLFCKMQAFITAEHLDELVDVVEVLVQETPTNAVVFSDGFASGLINGRIGWWSSPDPMDRSISKIGDDS